MGEQAKITSLDALETFRSELIIFLTKAHNSVDAVGDEVRRTRTWLQNDQRTRWEGEVRKWRRLLDQAQGELMNAKLSNLRDSTTAQELAVKRAKAALEHAEEKLRKVKLWNRDFDHYAAPLIKRVDSLRQYLDYDMPKALASIVHAQRTLESYSETAPAPKAAPSVAPPLPE